MISKFFRFDDHIASAGGEARRKTSEGTEDDGVIAFAKEVHLSVRRLTHFGICVSDLERSLRFYRDALGFSEVGRIEPDTASTSRLLGIDCKLCAVYLERDGWRMELLHYPEPGHTGTRDPRPMNQLGMTHLSFRVEDIDDVLEKLEAAGGRVLAESILEFGDGAVKALMALDPDGTRLELIEAPGDPNAIPGSR